MNEFTNSDPPEQTNRSIFTRRKAIFSFLALILGGGGIYIANSTTINTDPQKVPVIPTALPPLTDRPTPTTPEMATATAVAPTATATESTPGATPGSPETNDLLIKIYNDKLLEESGLSLRSIDVAWTVDSEHSTGPFSPSPELSAIYSKDRIVGLKIRLKLQSLDQVNSVFSSFSIHDNGKNVDVPELNAYVFTPEIMETQSTNLFGPKAAHLPLDYYIIEDGSSLAIDNQPYKNANVLKYPQNWKQLDRTYFQAYSSPVLTVENGNIGLDISVQKSLSGSFQLQ